MKKPATNTPPEVPKNPLVDSGETVQNCAEVLCFLESVAGTVGAVGYRAQDAAGLSRIIGMVADALDFVVADERARRTS